jgi:hypothetical protein
LRQEDKFKLQPSFIFRGFHNHKMEIQNREIQTVAKFVEEVLSEDDRSRNDNKWLILQTLRKMGFKIYIDYAELQRMPAFGTITRCGRFIQNTKGKHIPNKETDRLRRANEDLNRTIWKNSYLGDF